jgi:CubicO group peptidase (beta-lactamase class C family)
MTRRELLAGLAFALKRDRLSKAEELLKNACASGEVRAASLYVRQGAERWTAAAGAANPRTVFLLASITKPFTAAGVMRLVDQGAVRLEDKVEKYIPEFRGGERAKVTVRMLLTHTSGWPDMLPENDELRRRHAPLKEFVAGTCRTPLLFSPGTRVKYQSMGILLAAEIAERVTRRPFREYLSTEVFAPLGMKDTSLGLGGRAIPDTAQCQVTGNDDWNWNSPYWRNLGAPWGGAHAPAEDVGRFLEAFMNPEGRVVKAETAAAMVANQNAGLNDPWGIGFQVKPGGFGKACSPETFGHSGSTGTASWADPKTGTSFVLLTTKPAEFSRATVLKPVSDLVSEAA